MTVPVPSSSSVTTPASSEPPFVARFVFFSLNTLFKVFISSEPPFATLFVFFSLNASFKIFISSGSVNIIDAVTFKTRF
jgi:hypothetical protein